MALAAGDGRAEAAPRYPPGPPCGRVAQWKSTRFVIRVSKVRSLLRPPTFQGSLVLVDVMEKDQDVWALAPEAVQRNLIAGAIVGTRLQTRKDMQMG